MIKKITLVTFIICFFSIPAFTQRLSIGPAMDFFSLYYTHFKSEYYYSNRTYKTYYIPKNQVAVNGIINYGANTRVDFGKIAFGFAGFISNHMLGLRYNYNFPVANGEFRTYYSKIEFGEITAIPYINYTLRSFGKVPYFIEAGICHTWPMSITEDISRMKDFKTGWFGEREIREDLNMDEIYNKYYLAVGIKTMVGEINAKIYIRHNKSVLNPNYFTYFTLGFTTLVKFSNLRKTNLYFE